MAEAYIVEARRTAGGSRNGRLPGWHPANLAGAVLTDLVGRIGIDPGAGYEACSAKIRERVGVDSFSQLVGAEMIAREYGYDRAMLDAYALTSHSRASAATKAGAFEREIVPIAVETPEGSAMHLVDEGIRFDATPESIGAVRLLQKGGVISAANASQICDGASGVLVVSERALKEHGLTPPARMHNLTVTAGDPVIMLEEPLFATERALARAGMSIDEIDLYEVNEAFAPVPMAWLRHTKTTQTSPM